MKPRKPALRAVVDTSPSVPQLADRIISEAHHLQDKLGELAFAAAGASEQLGAGASTPMAELFEALGHALHSATEIRDAGHEIIRRERHTQGVAS